LHGREKCCGLLPPAFPLRDRVKPEDVERGAIISHSPGA